MRIAIVAFGLEGRGGKETVISRVVNGMNNLGEEAQLFYLGGSTIDNNWINGIPSRTIGSPSDHKLIRYVKYGSEFPKSLIRFKPDIIVAADERAVFICKMVTKLKRLKIPVASWIHSSLTHSERTQLIKFADFHFALNLELANQLRSLDSTKNKNIYVIYNPVETAASSIPRPQTTTFIYVGRLLYDGSKRVNDFLSALSNILGDWKAIIIGDGPDRMQLQQLAVNLNINKNVKWLGWKEEPWKHVRQASALVLTSEYEGFGMVLVEAMSRGVPCISSNCPVGPSEIIKEGINGWLYPTKDIGKLSDVMQHIIDHPSVLPSHKSVRDSVSHFNTNAMLTKMKHYCLKEIERMEKIKINERYVENA